MVFLSAKHYRNLIRCLHPLLVGSLILAVAYTNINGVRNHANNNLECGVDHKKVWREASVLGASNSYSLTSYKAETPQSDTTRPTLPNVLIIGAQKAGTTTLSNYLFSDRSICGPTIFPGEPTYYRKEVHFFDNKARFSKGLTFYSKRFQHCANSKYILEATPDLEMWASRVNETYSLYGNSLLSELKVIFTLREPISRELSSYNHMVNLHYSGSNFSWIKPIHSEDGSVMNFTEYVNKRVLKDINGGSSRIHYKKWLNDWMTIIPRKNILVLSYDELKSDPDSYVRRVRKFLALPPHGKGHQLGRANSKESSFKVLIPPCSVQEILRKKTEQLNDELYKFLEDNECPEMEQRPFPKFVLSECTLLEI